MSLLTITDLEVCYGEAQALFGVTLNIEEGEFVTLLGRNGMGKTTSVKACVGWQAAKSGSIVFGGQSIVGLPTHEIAKLGIGLVPEQRQIFGNLTVYENLVATARHQGRDSAWNLARVYNLFPRLKERKNNLGANLSGGEQQMLALGRALMTNPRILILDEATEGLAPLVRGEIWHCLESLRQTGLSILIIDKNIGPLLRLADRHFIMEKGRIVWNGTSEELKAESSLLHQTLGV